jgi:hypothetical protein
MCANGPAGLQLESRLAAQPGAQMAPPGLLFGGCRGKAPTPQHPDPQCEWIYRMGGPYARQILRRCSSQPASLVGGVRFRKPDCLAVKHRRRHAVGLRGASQCPVCSAFQQHQWKARVTLGYPYGAQARPANLAWVVSNLKLKYGVKYVYCWHGLPAYWAGVHASPMNSQGSVPNRAAAAAQLYVFPIQWLSEFGGVCVSCMSLLTAKLGRAR